MDLDSNHYFEVPLKRHEITGSVCFKYSFKNALVPFCLMTD